MNYFAKRLVHFTALCWTVIALHLGAPAHAAVVVQLTGISDAISADGSLGTAAQAPSAATGPTTYMATQARYVYVTGTAFDEITNTSAQAIAIWLTPQPPLTTSPVRATATVRTDATQALLPLRAQRPTSDSLNAIAQAGFIVAIDTLGLDNGTYLINSAMADGQSVPIGTPYTLSLGARAPATIQVKPVGVGQGTSARLIASSASSSKLADYEALRSGDYSVVVPTTDAFGRVSGAALLPFTYARQQVVTSLLNPLADDFPGQQKSVRLEHPITHALLAGPLPVVVTTAGGVPGGLNGMAVPATGPGVEATIVATTAAAGYKVRGSTQSDTGQLNVWIKVPDAPDLIISTNSWSLDGAMQVKPQNANGGFTTSLEPVVVKSQAAQESPARCKAAPYAVQPNGNPFGRGVDAREPQCAIRWMTLPDGVTQLATTPVAELSGFLTTSGQNDATYETGILYTNSDDGTTRFYRATSNTLNLTGTNPVPIELSFKATDPLAKIKREAGVTSPLQFFVPVGTRQMPGVVIASSNYIGLNVTMQWDGEPATTTVVNQRGIQAPVYASVQTVGQTRTLTVTAKYAKKPDLSYAKTFEFTAIPAPLQVALDRPDIAVTTVPLTVTGKFGQVNAEHAFTYDASQMGEWTITLATTTRNGVPGRSLGTATTTIAADGGFSVDVGTLPSGTFEIVATATLTSPVNGFQSTLKSGGLWLTVRDGTVMPVTVSTMTTSGAVPFAPAIMATFTDAARASDMSAIRWEVDRGSGWEAMLDTAGVPENKSVVRPNLTRSGTYSYRAIVTNRWTQNETTTNQVTVTAFVRPTLTISGPNAGFVGYPANLTITSDLADNDIDIRWTVVRGSSDRNPITGSGSAITFTPASAANYAITVVASQLNAPPNDSATKRTATFYYTAAVPILPPPVITGTRTPEVGKTYTYTAAATTPFSASANTNWTIKSKWILPDGTEQPAGPLSLTVGNAPNQVLRYVVWIDGMPGSEVTTSLTLLPWVYTWPQWSMTSKVLDSTAPARVQLQIATSDARAVAALNGEPLVYTWNIPAGATVTSQARENSFITLPQGSWVVTGTVSDSRGNSTNVSSATITVGPPSELIFTVDLSSSSDRFMRAPLTLGATLRVTSLPRGDAFESANYILDGTSIGTIASQFGTLVIPTAGNHTLQVTARTRGGQTATRSVDITVAEGDAPVCTIAAVGSGPTTLTANCVVQLGFVGNYEWHLTTSTGTTKVGAARTLIISVADLARTQSVTLKAITDKGKQSSFTWTKP